MLLKERKKKKSEYYKNYKTEKFKSLLKIQFYQQYETKKKINKVTKSLDLFIFTIFKTSEN